MGFNTKTGTAFRDFLEAHGTVKESKMALAKMLKDKEISATDFSLKEVLLACETANMKEANTSDLFPLLTGELINSQVISGYDNPDLVGDRLVTIIPSKLKQDKLASISGLDMPEEVLENASYNESLMEEGNYVTSDNKKFGRLLSISEEAIHFDKTAEIMRRANNFGEKARLFRERMILNGIQDITGYKVYHPLGVQTDAYSATLGNLSASSPFGESSMEKIYKIFHDQVDSEGDPIIVSPSNAIALVPVELWNRANQMAKSILVPEGVENAVNSFAKTFEPLTSPYVTQQSATTYYFGNFKRAFSYLEVWPLQTFVMKPGNEDEFKRDIKLTVKVRLFGSVAMVDPKYVAKCTA